MKVEKVLNIEDTMTKHVAVLKALNKCGIQSVDHATTAMEGLAKIELAIEEGNPYDLIVSDMYFPLFPGERDTQAGMYIIKELKNRKWNIPVVVCSSARFRIPEIVGCIYYDVFRGDLDADMREMVEIVRNM
uniref:response regulator n=1 Tax=Agathobacter sp. TaxID=2021311 RepID=UPI004056AD73